jgi:hypothetical protein
MNKDNGIIIEIKEVFRNSSGNKRIPIIPAICIIAIKIISKL